MRVTQSLYQTKFLTALDTLESNLSQTQNQVSSGLAFTTPSQNPIAAGTVNNYAQALAQSTQYTANGSSAQTSLETEGTALSQLQNQLQSLRSLALEANSGIQTGEDLTAIATQATQIQNSLLSLGGAQVALTGQPAVGDSFSVAPSSNQSLFTTVQNLVNAIQTGAGGSSGQTSLNHSIATQTQDLTLFKYI
jgi:flagellar hook-associated protein 3 FlgL